MFAESRRRIEAGTHSLIMSNTKPIQVTLDRTLYDHANADHSSYKSTPGLTEPVVREISAQKNEPKWLLEKRLKALELFQKTPLPAWGPDLSKLNLDEIVYFVRPDAREATDWAEVPEEIKKTFDRLGIPAAEKTVLGGVGAQYDSNVIYHNIRADLKKKGVIFENMDVAVREYPEFVQKYFMTQCIPINDHKFIMLHAAVWSGGTFIYVPKGVKVDLPLQAYFRMNAEAGGQFEHTLIIADEGSDIQYIEGCSAPRYSKNSLHAGCVEIFVHRGARARYYSIENWSKNTYNLNTKRALVDENGVVEWINGNMGCLTGDTLLYTNLKGPVEIKDIQVEETIYAWNQQTHRFVQAKIKNKIFSGHKKVFCVKAGGRDIEASGNHPFLTLTRKKNSPSHKKGFFHFEWKPLEELGEGDLIGIAKKLPVDGRPYVLPQQKVGVTIKSRNQYSSFFMSTRHLYNELTIPKKTDEDFMWLMGLILGDGHIDSKRNKINIATHVTEDYRDELCNVLYKSFGYMVTEKKERYIIINSKVLCQLFSEIGFGGTASTKSLPAWVFALPESQIQALLAGYFDSDGHVADNAIAYTSINKNLLEQIKMLGQTLGYGVSHIMRHGVKGKTVILGKSCQASDSWRLLFNGPTAYQLPARCQRKKDKIKNMKTRRKFSGSGGLNFRSKTNEWVGFTQIQHIEPIGVKPTYDIEVEGYHNFVANGLIVHNSGVTMLYPCSVLRGRGARSDSLGVAFAGPGQNQDTGSKVIHAAPDTKSTIKAKSISAGGGISTYRGLVKVTKKADGAVINVECDALLMDDKSVSNTEPCMKIDTNLVDIAHEARVGKIGDDELFYLMSRGMSLELAMQMVVAGFIEPVVKALPLEYALELNKLIELEMEGSVG